MIKKTSRIIKMTNDTSQIISNNDCDKNKGYY